MKLLICQGIGDLRCILTKMHFKSGRLEWIWCVLITIIVRIIYLAADTVEQERFCHARSHLINSVKGGNFKVVDAKANGTVIMECHYCNEKDDEQPKVWYKYNFLEDQPPAELSIDMDSDSTVNRITATPEHTLIIRHITVRDTAYYSCFSTVSPTQNALGYILDVSSDVKTPPIIGDLSDWRKFQQSMLLPLNEEIRRSLNNGYVKLGDDLNMQLEAVTEWELWGPCVICNRVQGEKRRVGKCRLKPKLNQGFGKVKHHSLKGEIPRTALEFSCNSELLEQKLTNISRLMKHVPDFVQVSVCKGTCHTGQKGISQKKRAQRKKFYTINEGSNFSIMCSGVMLQDVVTWHKNGKPIVAAHFENDRKDIDKTSRLVIDTFGTIHLFSITKHDEGNYTCFSNNYKVQEVKIYIMNKSRISGKGILRYMTYFCYIFILNLICYCGVLRVKWKQRHKFRGYNDQI